MKTCSRCGVDKGIEEFYKRAATEDGLAYSCKVCSSRYQRERRLQFPEKVLAQNLKSILVYKLRYPGKIEQRDRERHLKQLYGLSLDEYNSLLASQSGVCALCGGGSGQRRFAVDHCHSTGKVRGLLCRACNTGLGLFKDSPALLEKGAAYLRKGTS